MAVTLPEYATTSRLLSRKQVMELLGVSHDYLSRMTNHKNPDLRIPAYRLSYKCVKYKYDEVMWWLEKQRVG